MAHGARSVRMCGSALAVLLAGCAGGDDTPTSGFSGFASNPSATNPTAPSSNGDSSGDSSGEGGSTMAVDPTTGAPMTTVPMTTEPMTTAPMTTDATTTTTGNTTNTSTGSTTNNTTTTTTTDGSSSSSSSSSTTDPPPPPPPKDPQPADGLYADCKNKACNMNLTDGCFELQDQNMVKIDGYCTLFCNTDADCQPKPVSPATTKCVNIGANQTVCMLACNGLVDCPTGMTCESVNINNMPGKYCW